MQSCRENEIRASSPAENILDSLLDKDQKRIASLSNRHISRSMKIDLSNDEPQPVDIVVTAVQSD